MDVENIDNGRFEEVIFKRIETCPHFIIVLAYGTLDRCRMSRDFLRREIEYALMLDKNIIPILGGRFSIEDANPFLKGKLKSLKNYQALSIPDEYFDAAMKKLYKRLTK